MEGALGDAKALFRRAAEYFGEDGDGAAAAAATEPERFFSKLLGFLTSLKKARDDRLRVEHCLAADPASPAAAAKKAKEEAAATPPPGRVSVPALKMRSAPEPRGEAATQP